MMGVSDRVVSVMLVAASVISITSCESHAGHFTNDFAVELDGDHEVAELVASVHGFTLVRQIKSLGNVYHFTHEATASRSKRSADHLVDKLSKDPSVRNVEQQRVLSRIKRKIVHDKQKELAINDDKNKSMYERHYLLDSPEDSSERKEKSNIPHARWINEMGFNDPYYPDQWYYSNQGQTGGKEGMDVNVLPVWKKGLTGKGVVVSILDDGVDYTHPDLKDNYDPDASIDLNDRNADPLPDVSSSDNSHGTRCAGEIAAKANNDNCGVGIAHNARIGGVRMLDGSVTDLLEGEAISFKREYIDIYSASWGPSDNGATMEAPGRYCRKALEDGVEYGRDGKGSIFVWATGNGGMSDDDCSCDGYVSSIETLSIGCISDQGLSTYFTEACPSTMAVIVTGGSHARPGARAYSNPKIKVVTTDLFGKCTLEFQGTSAAAPLAAGCLALVLEANPELTWRDMQHIVVRTARIPNAEEEGWTINGGGHHVNNRFGFGAIDCGRMVEEAQDWQQVSPQRRCQVPEASPEKDISVTTPLRDRITVDGCSDDTDRVDRLEHVQVHIKLSHVRRGDLTIDLTSPSGTKSTLLSRRRLDDSSEGISFTFMTVHSWGENAAGEWLLEIRDQPRRGYNHDTRGVLHSWSMTLWGTDDTPKDGQKKQASDAPKARNDLSHVAEGSEVNKVMDKERDEADSLDIDFHQEKRKQLGDSMSDLIEVLNDEIDDTEDSVDALHLSKKNQAESLNNPASYTQNDEFVRSQNDVEIDQELDELMHDLKQLLEELEEE